MQKKRIDYCWVDYVRDSHSGCDTNLSLKKYLNHPCRLQHYALWITTLELNLLKPLFVNDLLLCEILSFCFQRHICRAANTSRFISTRDWNPTSIFLKPSNISLLLQQLSWRIFEARHPAIHQHSSFSLYMRHYALIKCIVPLALLRKFPSVRCSRQPMKRQLPRPQTVLSWI